VKLPVEGVDAVALPDEFVGGVDLCAAAVLCTADFALCAADFDLALAAATVAAAAAG
jgi:hypothetical protein